MKPRMTISELKELLKNGPVKLPQREIGQKSITIYAIDKRGDLVGIDENGLAFTVDKRFLENYPSQKPERTAYYRWKIWYEDGDIKDTVRYHTEENMKEWSGFFVKYEKIEGTETYECEGQLR